MLMTQNPGAINKLCTISDTCTITPCKVTNVSINSCVVPKGCCTNIGLQISPFPWKGFTRDKIHQPSHQRLLVRNPLGCVTGQKYLPKLIIFIVLVSTTRLGLF